MTVKDGAEFLDQAVPLWYTMIDLTKLKMESCELCILGQLEPHIPVPIDYDLYEEEVSDLNSGPDSYDIALIKLDIVNDETQYGFMRDNTDETWEDLKEEWIEEVNKRRG